MNPARIYWSSQVLSDLPDINNWLSDREHEVYAQLHVEKRRKEWLLGRWTGKYSIQKARAVEGSTALALDRIEILAAPDGAPEAYFDAEPIGHGISLTHREGRACAALIEKPFNVGCDLEFIEPRSTLFVEDYFTDVERAYFYDTRETDRPIIANTIWSAKEAALKTLRTGLRMDTRAVEVIMESRKPTSSWSTLRVSIYEKSQVLKGWWYLLDGFVLTIVFDGADDTSFHPKVLL